MEAMWMMLALATWTPALPPFAAADADAVSPTADPRRPPDDTACAVTGRGAATRS